MAATQEIARALVTSYRPSIAEIGTFVLQHATFSHPTSSLPKISPCSRGSTWMTFGLRRVEMFDYILFEQLVSKIFNLCGHDLPTLQTDRQTDDKR